MKNSIRVTILVTFLLLKIFSVNSQINTGVLPDSFTKQIVNMEQIDRISVTPPDMELIKKEDLQDEKNGTMMKIARLVAIDVDMETSGTWNWFSDGSAFWSISFNSEGAKGCALHFDRLSIPPGAEVFAYSPDKSLILGPYTSEDNPRGLGYTIGIFQGSEVILEYYPPKKSETQSTELILPDFELTRYSYIYRNAGFFDYNDKGTGYGASDNCQVNVNCSEGDNWRLQQRGVARVYAVQGWSAGLCTGSLVNNTSNDGTPYFLTADHCGGSATGPNFSQWVFWFNYEAPTCSYNTNTMPEPSRDQFTGCSRRARGPLDGGSDFLLLELFASEEQLKNIDAVYNGWRNNNLTSSSGVSIHHPSGDIKKISTYTSNLSTTTYQGQGETGATNAYWRVNWSSTTNGHGVTEGGSSGSPIFDNNGLIIGTLSGGSSYCDQPNWPDLYGKFSYHWESNGATNAERLAPWLDPNNTGNTSCDLYDPNAEGVNADFIGSPTNVAAGGTVSFTDFSTGNISSYSWSFPGGTPSSSNQPNPTVTYNTEGVYNVSLTVSDGTESDTETKTNYINVGGDACSAINNFPYIQIFNSSSLPDCWERQTTISSHSWQTSTGYSIGDFDILPQSGSHFYYCPWVAQNQNEWLVTPEFNFGTSSSPEISFWFNGSYHWSVSPNNNCDLDLMVSVSGGSWTSIWNETHHPDFNDDNTYIWLNAVVDLTAYSGQSNVRFAFRYTGNDGANFAVDNVKVDGTSVELYTLTINTSGEGTVNVNSVEYSSPVSVEAGTVLTLEAIPAQNWIFENWSGNVSGTPNPTSVTMNANRTITANFKDVSFIDDDLYSSFNVYPNPTEGKLFIEIPENSKASLRLVNILGKVMKETNLVNNENSLDIGHLSPGLYILEIETELGRIIKKINLK